MDSITRGIVVKMEDNKLVLDFHVIVAYGVSIMAVADNLVDNVKFIIHEIVLTIQLLYRLILFSNPCFRVTDSILLQTPDFRNLNTGNAEV